MASAFSGSGFERCPITHEVFRDPVVASDGHTYEREAIESWIFIDNIGSSACCRRRRRLSPMTGLPLETYVLLPNHALKKAIEERSQRLFGAKQSKHILASICVFLVSVLCVSYMLAAARSSMSLPPLGLHYEELRLTASAATHSFWSSHAGSFLLLAGVILCGTGLAVDDEKAAVGLVLTGVPLAIVSFFVGVTCANCGDRASALFLARCLVLSGIFFCAVGIFLAITNQFERRASKYESLLTNALTGTHKAKKGKATADI